MCFLVTSIYRETGMSRVCIQAREQVIEVRRREGIEVGRARPHSRRERHIGLLGRQGGKKDIREWIGINIFIQGNWSIRGVAME